jgi:hypothetical protein
MRVKKVITSQVSKPFTTLDACAFENIIYEFANGGHIAHRSQTMRSASRRRDNISVQVYLIERLKIFATPRTIRHASNGLLQGTNYFCRVTLWEFPRLRKNTDSQGTRLDTTR